MNLLKKLKTFQFKHHNICQNDFRTRKTQLGQLKNLIQLNLSFITFFYLKIKCLNNSNFNQDICSRSKFENLLVINSKSINFLI